MAKPEAAAGKPSGPRAVTRVLDLMALLARHPDGLGLTELSIRMGVAKSTFLDTLRGLCEQRYLVHQDGRYRLGAAAYRLATSIAANWSAPDMVRRQVNALARLTNESVGFAIADWELGQAIYTEAVNSVQPVRYAMQAGLRAPLYASAAGRVLLAFASPRRVDTYLDGASLRPLTARTRIDKDAIRSNLAAIRVQGYCASFGEMLNDTASIAAPTFGPDGGMLGAMMLAAPIDRMRSREAPLLAALLEASRQASAGPEEQVPSDGR